jgi:uncharacterized repeat protein (TIGR01451 family)
MKSDKKMAILLTTAFLFASWALLGVPAAGASGASYDVYVKTVDGWALQEQLYLSKYYETVSIDLSGVLPDVDGEYTVRIAQHGGIAAHIDYVALGEESPASPTSAICVDDGTNVSRKVVAQDNDVADAWGKTIECTWESSVSSPVLIVNANIEHYTIEAPIRTPCIMTPELMLPYVITNNGIITVDGVPDSLGAPDFSDYWTPASGHPYGYTYLWLRCDSEYLYGLMEITGDNTYDKTGWGSLYINANGALKEFRVDNKSHGYGVDGFVYTDKVAYQHIVYEFKIPLAEIGAGLDDSIKIGYGSYGTFMEPVQVDKWVYDGDQWVDELTAQINDTLRFKLAINYTSGDISERFFSDVLDCSLVFAGNATKNDEPFSELNAGGPYTFKPIVLHPHNLSWNPYNPDTDLISWNFTELCPDIGQEYRVQDGGDVNNDSRVSASDWLVLKNVSGAVAEYRVDNVPYTLNVTNTVTTESMYIDSVFDYEAVYLSNPNGSTWLEVCCYKDRYNLSAWYDTNVTGDLNVNDTIILQNLQTGQEAPYLVNEVTIDLVVSKAWGLNQSINWFIIEYDAQVIRCGIDNNTLRAYGESDCDSCYYNDSAVVTITPAALEVNKTVWNGSAWVKSIDTSINDTVKFRIEVHNNGTCCNLTNITVSDLLTFSLEYANNATVNGVACEPELISITYFTNNYNANGGMIFVGDLLWEYNASESCTAPFKELAPCETIVIEFDARVIYCGCDANYVQVVADGCDGTVYDEDAAGVSVPGIEISKFTFPAERLQGEVFNFSIGVCPCIGMRDAVGVIDSMVIIDGFVGECFDYFNDTEYIDVIDVLPEGLEYVSADPAPTLVMGNVIYWHFDNVTNETWEQLCPFYHDDHVDNTLLATAFIASGIQLTARVALNATGNLTDTAIASMKDTSGSVYKDVTNFTIYVPPPGLHVTKTPDWQWRRPWETATFIINATANGSLYTEKQVIDTMPAGMQFVGSTPAPDAQIGNQLIWNITDTYKNITLVVNFTGITFGRFKNLVEVKGKNATGVVHADKDHAYVSVSDKPDPVWVTKLPEDQTRNPGDLVLFTIETLVATNASTRYVITNDTLPRGLDYQSALCTNGSPILPTVYDDPVTGETVLTWNHTDFSPGENRTWNYVVMATVNTTVPPCTTLIDHADAYSYLIVGRLEDHDEARVHIPCPRIPVPALTPLGIAALVGLLSILATSTLVKKRKRR